MTNPKQIAGEERTLLEMAATQHIERVKASYRKNARAMTWEQKVASIEAMRDASAKARAAGLGASMKEEQA